MGAKSNQEEIGGRIKFLIHELHMNNNSFAIKIKMTAPGIAAIVNGKSNPKFDVIEKIMTAFPNVNQNWLVSGEGEMFINIEPQSNTKGKPKANDYLMEQLQALEQSWRESIEESKRISTEKEKIITQQNFMIETLMSQLNTALGKLDLSEEMPSVSEGRILDFKPLKINQKETSLTASLTVGKSASLVG